MIDFIYEFLQLFRNNYNLQGAKEKWNYVVRSNVLDALLV